VSSLKLLKIYKEKTRGESKMKNEKDEKRNDKVIPFFARYLEKQKALKIKSNIKAGATSKVTLKFPSDTDEAA
jgi:hypothetical protein